MTAIRIICPKCGSDNVAKDAVAVWSEPDQRWELAGVHDNETCNGCGFEGDDAMTREPITAVVVDPLTSLLADIKDRTS